jgi:hypothetical protein
MMLSTVLYCSEIVVDLRPPLMKQPAQLISTSLIVLALAQACTPLDTRVKYEVVKVDTNRGYAYPVTFDRALDLRRAEMFAEAAYVYIMLYNEHHDRVISESIEMANEIKGIEGAKSVTHYFQQAIGKEMMLDPEVRVRGGEINQTEMKKRYSWSAKLMDELAMKGIR